MSQALDGIISNLNALTQSEDEGGDDAFGYDEEEEDEHDADAEAEEIARRLKDELTAEIAKAQAEQAAAAASVVSRDQQTTLALPTAAGTSPLKKESAVLITMKSVLAYASKDPLVSFTLASASVLDTSGSKSDALQILQRSVDVGFIPKELAKPLSQVIVSLAKSEVLFASLKNSNAPAVLLDKGKRKREDTDATQPSKISTTGYWMDRMGYVLNEHSLIVQIKSAVNVITQSLSAASLAEARASTDTPSAPLDPSLVSSLQVPLHQVFLFAVTSASSSSKVGALQEIGGLIQMLGVLSGVQICPTQPASQQFQYGQPELNTAVYPCLLPSCHKSFSRLYSLRSHHRSHSSHPSIRPYRCTQCPASFARNHDLKRHLKLHGSKAFKCSGCGKVFSRRDAIKRHMNSSRIKSETAAPGGLHRAAIGGGFGRREEAERCRDGEVIEVHVEKEESEEGVKEERRAKIWGDRMASAVNSDSRGEEEPQLEEGEIPSPVLVEAQALVLGLFPLLSGYVEKYAPQSPSLVGITGESLSESSKTVASVMANWSQSDSVGAAGDSTVPEASLSSLSISWLSAEQTKQLEEAIATAARAAQEQAEAEAALEEEDDEGRLSEGRDNS